MSDIRGNTKRYRSVGRTLNNQQAKANEQYRKYMYHCNHKTSNSEQKRSIAYAHATVYQNSKVKNRTKQTHKRTRQKERESILIQVRTVVSVKTMC